MLRYFAGLLLVQIVTVGLFVLNADAAPRALALQAGLPSLAVALLAALWFRALAKVDGERDLARTRLEHERERERLQREAAGERDRLRQGVERERVELARDAERSVRREERRVGRRANLKVGLAFAATSGMGVLFVLSELLTLGLLTMTTAGGALGGYLLRWRQSRPVTASSTALPEGAGRASGPVSVPSTTSAPPRVIGSGTVVAGEGRAGPTEGAAGGAGSSREGPTTSPDRA